MRTALRSALTDAMKRRDREASSVFRAALSAIDNAGAVAVDGQHRDGAIELAVVGVGGSDVPRKDLTEQDLIQIVADEAEERRAAAQLIEATHPEDARRLRREAEMLSTVTHRLEGE